MSTNRSTLTIEPILQAVRNLDADAKTDGQLLEQFLARHDEAAFAALVRRHGPMVLGVCRRILGNAADSDDAFQATFIVLVRKASSLTSRTVLGDWLHGVARRTALKARTAAAHRRAKEAKAVHTTPGDAARNDWLPLLDAELSRLPEKYRMPIVLCDLENKTRREAAEQLGWLEGTVAGRLSRGRALLAKRLLRGAQVLSGVAPALAIGAAQAGMPPALVNSTAQSAVLVASGQTTAAGVLTAPVLALAKGVLNSMLLTKLRTALVVLAALSLLCVGVGLLAHASFEGKTPSAEAKAVNPAPKSDKDLIQGVWKVVTADHNGKMLPNETLTGDNQIWHIGDGRITVRYSDGTTKEILYRLDPSKMPKAVDVEVRGEGDYKYLGIYDLAGDTLKFAYSRNVAGTRQRPTAFDSTEFLDDRGRRCFVLRRQQDAPLPKAPDKNRETKDALGDPFPPGALRRFGSNRLSHQGNVSCTAYSPDGRYLASGGYDGSVRLWDPATGKELGQFTCPRWVRAFHWSAKSDVLIYASDGDGIRFTEVATGKLLQHFKGKRPYSVTDLALSSDGKTLAAAEVNFGESSDYGVRLWDVAAGKELYQFKVPRSYCIDFSPDRRVLAVGGDKNVRLWEVATGKELPALAGHDQGTYAVAFSPDGKLLASGGTTLDEGVILWDPNTGREVRRLPKLGGTVYSLAFSPDGKTLATGAAARDGSPIRLWDVATGNELRDLKGIVGPVEQISFSPDGTRVASASCWGRTLYMWDVATGTAIRPFVGHHAELSAVAFSPDGGVLATASWDGAIILWKTASGARIGTLLGHEGRVNALACSPDGQLLASGGQDKTVRLWSTSTGKEVRAFVTPKQEIACVVFAPDGRTLVAAESMLQEENMIVGAAFPNCAVRVWDVATGAEVRQLEGKTGRVDTVAFSPDGRILASAGPDAHLIHLWDAATGQALRKLQSADDPSTPPAMAEGITRIAFSPDGRTLASVSCYRYPHNMRQIDKEEKREVRMVRLWEVVTGDERQQIRVGFRGPEGQRDGPRNEITCVTFSADGRALILGRADGDLSVWDIPRAVSRLVQGHQDRVPREGRLLATGWDNTPRIAAITLSPDGKTIATGSWDTTAMLWDAAGWSAAFGRQDGLTREQLDTLWTELAAADGVRAFRALWSMAAAAEDAASLLDKRLRPIPRMPAGRIERLLGDLDNGVFAVREKARVELETYEDAALPSLRKALAGSGVSLEARRRIETLLARHASAPPPDALRAYRSVEVLEHIGNAKAQTILRTLASGEPAARLTQEVAAALKRLAKD